MTFYKVNSPILFLIFNRPDITFKVFERIKEAQPSKLYVSADGPRIDKDEVALCTEARSITEMIDWECEVKTLFRTKNLGCRDAVSSAITWFFENEEEGIILEDDCLPANFFFAFCDALLHRYRSDDRIRHISGCNLQFKKTWGTGSYYFSNLTHVWGWASWRRVWKEYDKELTNYHEDEVGEQILNIFADPLIAENWKRIFRAVKSGEINTWDYQLTFINFFNNSLSIIPNQNLISNIGFRSDATHTVTPENPYSNIPLSSLTEIKHPVYILPSKCADFKTLDLDFGIEQHHKKTRKLSFRLKSRIKKLL